MPLYTASNTKNKEYKLATYLNVIIFVFLIIGVLSLCCKIAQVFNLRGKKDEVNKIGIKITQIPWFLD